MVFLESFIVSDVVKVYSSKDIANMHAFCVKTQFYVCEFVTVCMVPL